MSGLARVVLDALREDPDVLRELRDVLGVPSVRETGWVAASEAAAFLGLGSLDALDRLVHAGLPFAQPHGPGGRRYFSRHALNEWMSERT